MNKFLAGIEEDLRKAHIKDSVTEHIRKIFILSVFVAIGLGAFFFFISKTIKMSPLLAIPVALVSFVVIFLIFINSPKTKINKRMRDLDKEVLFAGRFLLVKLHSGKPLLNAIIEASHGYGVAGGYFKEIVDDINMGTPIEEALNNAIRYSPSDKFRKIIFHISNAIKIGIDVSGSLSNALDEISKEQLIEIQKYGKKLNSLSMFYMLLAVVMPSLGVAMLMVIGTLLGLFSSESTVNLIFIAVLALLFAIQFMFLIIFKSSRLMVNL
jgi:pilus assembly protein TadC